MRCRQNFLCVLAAAVGAILWAAPDCSLGQTTFMVRLYPGPGRSPDQVASLSTVSPVVIEDVNGLAPACCAQISLLPGPHAVTISYSGRGKTVLGLEAKPGHSYQVRGYAEADRWVGTIVDLATMDSVSESPAFVEDQMGYRARDGNGDWRYVNGAAVEIGRLAERRAGSLFVNAVDAAMLESLLGKESAAAYLEKARWWLNSKGLALRHHSGKFIENQRAFLFNKSRVGAGAMFIGEGNPVVLRNNNLYALLDGGEIVNLVGLAPPQIEKLSGIAQKIAQSFLQRGVTRVEAANLYFTHATNGDLVADITVKDRTGNKQTLVLNHEAN